ncbi:MAG: PhoPQ-activated protein PqaA family protein [Planctomycetaceae bacterium]
MPLRRLTASLVLLLTVAATAIAEDAAAVGGRPEEALARYIAKPESVYGWTLKEKAEAGGILVYKLELTSQTWQGIEWKHVLHVYEPKNVQFHDHVLLFVSGGSGLRPPGLDEQLLAVGLANMSGGRVALLKQVPNQPLFDDRVEDDLITETWLQYLKTGDQSWPLLFPMVKSAVKAMDAVTELSKQEGWPQPVEKFVVTGASKRGWTSWLTPVADSRVVATAPCVIDTLNFRAQMKDQVETWGTFSEQIADYSSKGLIRANGEKESPREAALRTMMDPWTYREQITIPKLIINGTNDRYWVVDAAKNYYPGLVGPKHVLEIPNAGHSLDGGLGTVTATIAVFYRRTAARKAMPTLEWKFDATDAGQRRLVLSSDSAAQSARLWTAASDTNDFREAAWSDRSMTHRDDRYSVALPDSAENQSLAAFGELRFVDRTVEPPVQFALTTTVKTYLAPQEAAGE